MKTFPGIISEDAAIFGYGLVLAHSRPDIAAAVRARLIEHRARRDSAQALWPDAPAAPVGYAASADLPHTPVELAIRLESDCCEGWREQIGITDNEEQRRLCVDALCASAVSLARWRTLVPGTPFEEFPGFPRTS